MKSTLLPDGFTHWTIVFVIALATGTIAVVFWQMYGVSQLGMIEFLNATGRLSFPIFLIAFLARPLYQIAPNALTCWMVSNRRYIGLAFAVMYGYHAIGWIGLKQLTGQWGFSGLMLGLAGVAYLFLGLMTLTSFQRIYRIVPIAWWHGLHTTGMYVLWACFQLEFFRKIQTTATWYYGCFALMAFVALIVRSLAWKITHPQSIMFLSTAPSSTVPDRVSITPSPLHPSNKIAVKPDTTLAYCSRKPLGNDRRKRQTRLD